MKEGAMALFLLAVAALAWGGEQASLKRGEELFTSKQLGTNGRSCADCHPGGKKLRGAAGYGDEELAGIINQCIRKPLHGEPLAPGSDDLKSLVRYVRSLASSAKP